MSSTITSLNRNSSRPLNRDSGDEPQAKRAKTLPQFKVAPMTYSGNFQKLPQMIIQQVFFSFFDQKGARNIKAN